MNSIPLLHPSLDSPETILSRLSYSPFSRKSGFTSSQAMADQAVSSFLEGVTKAQTLTALTGGSYAYRLGRLGVLGLGVGFQGGVVMPVLLRGGSYLVGFAAESATFAGVNRAFSSMEGEKPLHSFTYDWAQAAATLAPLKIIPSLFQDQNLVLQHLVTDGSMVAGNHLASRFNLGEKPEGNLFTQLFHAEAVNWQMKGAMALAQATTPKIFALERGLDLSIRTKEGGLQTLPQAFPSYAMAAVGNPSAEPRIFEEGRSQAEGLYSKMSTEGVGESSFYDQITKIINRVTSSCEKVNALSEWAKDRPLSNLELELLIDVIGRIGTFEEKLIPLGALGSSEKRSTEQLQILIYEIKIWYASYVDKGGSIFLSNPISLLTKNPNLSDRQLEDLVQFSLHSQQVPDAKVVTLEAISIHPNLPEDLFNYIAVQMQKLNPKYFKASFLDGKHPFANHPGWVAYREKISKNESDENPKPGLEEERVADSTLVSIAGELSQRASTSEKDAERCEREGYATTAAIYRKQAERLRQEAVHVLGLTRTELLFEKDRFLARGPDIKASAEAYFQQDGTSGLIRSFDAEGFKVRAGMNEDQVEFRIATSHRKKAEGIFRVFIEKYKREGSARRALEWLVREHKEVTAN